MERGHECHHELLSAFRPVAVQFDFLDFIHPVKDSYEVEIKTLGGRVFFMSNPWVRNGSIEQIEKFLQEIR